MQRKGKYLILTTISHGGYALVLFCTGNRQKENFIQDWFKCFHLENIYAWFSNNIIYTTVTNSPRPHASGSVYNLYAMESYNQVR